MLLNKNNEFRAMIESYDDNNVYNVTVCSSNQYYYFNKGLSNDATVAKYVVYQHLSELQYNFMYKVTLNNKKYNNGINYSITIVDINDLDSLILTINRIKNLREDELLMSRAEWNNYTPTIISHIDRIDLTLFKLCYEELLDDDEFSKHDITYCILNNMLSKYNPLNFDTDWSVSVTRESVSYNLWKGKLGYEC